MNQPEKPTEKPIVITLCIMAGLALAMALCAASVLITGGNPNGF